MGGNSTVMIDQISRTILSRTCPLTSGRPTVFYGKEPFKRACDAKQEEAKMYRLGDNSVVRAKPQGKCGECLGRNLPPEIEIRAKGEVVGMGSASTKLGSCEICGMKTGLRTVHQLRTCPTCQRALALVNNHIGIVIKCIKHLSPEKLADLVGGQVSVGVESEVLQRIATIIGYAGTDGDGLVAEVQRVGAGERGLSTDFLLRLRTALARPVGSIQQLADDVEQLVAKIEELQGDLEAVRAIAITEMEIGSGAAAKPSDDVLKALGCGADDWELAVLQTAALLDARTDGVLRVDTSNTELRVIRAMLGEVTDRDCDLPEAVGELMGCLSKCKEQCEQLTERVAELRDLERLNAWHNQIFRSVGEVLNIDGLQPGELVGHIKALRDAAGYYGAVPGTVERSGEALCGQSIEVAVGGLTIKINGVQVNQGSLAEVG